MTAAAAVAPLVITGCGVVCAAGIGLDALAGRLPAAQVRRGPEADLAAIGGDFPPMPLTATPELRAENTSAEKGSDPWTGPRGSPWSPAIRRLHAWHTTGAARSRQTGVVIGTSTADSAVPASSAARRSCWKSPTWSASTCSPARWRTTTRARSPSGTRFAARTPRSRAAACQASAAIRFARNAISQGHVHRALVGAVEELSAQSAWAWYLSGALVPGAAVGEGSAIFVVETPAAAAAAGRVAVADCWRVRSATPAAGRTRRPAASPPASNGPCGAVA